VVKRYKSLAEVERGFGLLTSEIEIGPIYHRLPERIRADAAICFIALILNRIMPTRLCASDTALSPERALAKLRRIQHHGVMLNGTESVAGISSINKQQIDILAALSIKKPMQERPITVLG
jgi:transposase